MIAGVIAEKTFHVIITLNLHQNCGYGVTVDRDLPVSGPFLSAQSRFGTKSDQRSPHSRKFDAKRGEFVQIVNFVVHCGSL